MTVVFSTFMLGVFLLFVAFHSVRVEWRVDEQKRAIDALRNEMDQLLPPFPPIEHPQGELAVSGEVIVA